MDLLLLAGFSATDSLTFGRFDNPRLLASNHSLWLCVYIHKDVELVVGVWLEQGPACGLVAVGWVLDN